MSGLPEELGDAMTEQFDIVKSKLDRYEGISKALKRCFQAIKVFPNDDYFKHRAVFWHNKLTALKNESFENPYI